MPDPFSYIGEVLEQRLLVPPPPFGPPAYAWYFNQTVPVGASVVLYTDGTEPASITQGAASAFAPGFIPKGAFTIEAIHSAEFHTTQLDFHWPGIFRLYVESEIPVDSILLNVNAEIMGGHGYLGLPPIDAGNPNYNDGAGLAKKAHEHYVFEHDPGQAPEALTLRDGSAEGDPTTLVIETSEARHWRLILLPVPGHYEDVALGSGSWVFIGLTLASWHGRGVPTEGPTLTAEAGWTKLQARYSRDGDNLKLDHFPADGFPGQPILFPFHQAVSGASPRRFFGSLDRNWSSGTLFIAYKLSRLGGLWPFNLYSWQGHYYRTNVDATGRVWVRRSMQGQLPFDLEQAVTTGPDERPTLCIIPHHDRLNLFFERIGTGVLQTVSDDDGVTWATPELVMAGARFPLPCVDPNGNLVIGLYFSGGLFGILVPSGEAARNRIQFTDQAAVALAVEEDTFGLAWRDDNQSVLVLTCHITGEDEPSEWECTDGGEYFRFKRAS